MDQNPIIQEIEKWTWILLTILSTPATLAQYEIQPLGNNLGLFYAKVELLPITNTYWRIIFYMNLLTLQAHLQFDNISTDINHVSSTYLNPSKAELQK